MALIGKVLVGLCLVLAIGNRGLAQTPVAGIRNGYTSSSDTPRLVIERAMIYAPTVKGQGKQVVSGLYNHHASITRWKGKFIAIWSNGIVDEDAPGQQVVFSFSKDFYHWSAPQVLAKPSLYRGDTANILTAAGFHLFRAGGKAVRNGVMKKAGEDKTQNGDTLVAYYGEYSPKREHTHLWARTSVDGEHWSNPLDMHLPVNPNHGPQAIAGGRLVISGNFTFPYTDDPSGLSGWKMSSVYPDSLYREDNPATFYAPAAKMGFPPLCEGSFFQTDDAILHMLLRVTGEGWKGRLWLTESKDRGAHWSLPAETAFTDNDSKFHFGRLPDGRFYYAGIPDTLHHYARTPLVLMLSKDGIVFDKQYIIAEQPYILKKEGLWKDGQYGYPHTLIDGGYLYVIVSRQKEAIEILRFTISQL